MKDIEKKYIEMYKEYHKDDSKYSGDSLPKEVKYIKALVEEYNANDVLDYGCGKGRQYTELHRNRSFNIDDNNIHLYDPAVEELSKFPERTFSGVVCTDVLEHVPKEALDITLGKIFSLAEDFVYLAICTRPAIAILPNGENAHATVETVEWWTEKVKANNTKNIRCDIRLFGNHNGYVSLNKPS